MKRKFRFRTAALVNDTSLIYLWEPLREEVYLTIKEAENYCRGTLAMRDADVLAVKAIGDDGLVIKVRRQ